MDWKWIAVAAAALALGIYVGKTRAMATEPETKTLPKGDARGAVKLEAMRLHFGPKAIAESAKQGQMGMVKAREREETKGQLKGG